MNVLILEACRSPEVKKGLTESLALSQMFRDNGIEYELYSNDGIWENRVELDLDLIGNRLKQSSIDIVHFAVHGSDRGLILKWSNSPDIRKRVPLTLISGYDIREIKEFRGKLVVSGACASAQFANDFLAAGACAVVAPLVEIPWSKLGLFFRSFYLYYRSSSSAKKSLFQAIEDFPLYSCYHVYES